MRARIVQGRSWLSMEACREARVPEVATRSALAVEDDRVRQLVEGIRRGRDGADRQCAALARQHPGYAMHAPCGS